MMSGAIGLSRIDRAFRGASSSAPGVMLCFMLAGLAIVAARMTDLPAAMLALLAGLCCNRLAAHPGLSPGIDITSRTLLRLAVALIGIRISLPEIARMGLGADLVSMLGLFLCIGSGLVVGRFLRLTLPESLVAAGAVGICGASAALALSAVLPEQGSNRRHTAFVVASVTLISTAAMILYPLVALALGLSDRQAGLFFGAAIHDLTQVVGAGASVSATALDSATIAKLVRIALLMPVVALAAMAFGRAKSGEGGGAPVPILPGFLVGFALLALVSGLGIVPSPLVNAANASSGFLMIAATAALGLSTRVADLRGCGWRPLALVLVQTVVIAAWALAGAMLVEL